MGMVKPLFKGAQPCKIQQIQPYQYPIQKTWKGSNVKAIYGSPSKAMQVWKYRPVLLFKRLIFPHVLSEAIICN
jgi:hypothetical protein